MCVYILVYILYLHHGIHKKKKDSNSVHRHQYIHGTTTICYFLINTAHTSHRRSRSRNWRLVKTNWKTLYYLLTNKHLFLKSKYFELLSYTYNSPSGGQVYISLLTTNKVFYNIFWTKLKILNEVFQHEWTCYIYTLWKHINIKQLNIIFFYILKLFS